MKIVACNSNRPLAEAVAAQLEFELAPEGPLAGRKGRKRMAVVRRGGKPAVTHFRRLAVFGTTASLLECRLETGRTHQVRIHLGDVRLATMPVLTRDCDPLVAPGPCAAPETVAFAGYPSGELLSPAVVAWSVATRRRPIEATMASWFGAMLFALIPLQGFMPGAPPVGAWIDVFVFLWVEITLLTSMGVFIISWLRYREVPSYPHLRSPDEPAES